MSAAPVGEGARAPGRSSTRRPAAAASQPPHSSGAGRSPAARPAPIMLACTKPNRMSAPDAASRSTYAKAKNAAYRNNASADPQPPSARVRPPVSAVLTRSASAATPAARGGAAKLAGSIAVSLSASRHRMELPANASIVSAVSATARAPAGTTTAGCSAGALTTPARRPAGGVRGGWSFRLAELEHEAVRLAADAVAEHGLRVVVRGVLQHVAFADQLEARTFRGIDDRRFLDPVQPFVVVAGDADVIGDAQHAARLQDVVQRAEEA